MKKLVFYIIFFAVLITGFLFFSLKDFKFSTSKLAVINNNIPEFSFTNQNRKVINKESVENKVYVAEYFFTTCKGICPKMNANMRRVYETFRDERDFMILSHTCMPETDSVPVLKEYENKMIQSKLVLKPNGSYAFNGMIDEKQPENKNWQFLTGPKDELYYLARKGYMIDNGNPDTSQNINDQFIHTQFFALVDRFGRLRGVYDGLKNNEVDKLMKDVRELLEEKVKTSRFMSGFGNSPG